MTLLHGDSLEILKTLPANSIDAVVTDPPYGLGKEPAACKLMKDWIEKGYSEISGKGFMGKEWDAFVPQPNLWREVYRVLKPGGHVLSFFGTRTYDWGVVAMRIAGFEVRDQVQYIYGSGFPKSHNLGCGMGSALKPANEPIVLARKPLEKGLTLKANFAKWGCGALNVDASRIGLAANEDVGKLNARSGGRRGFSNEYVGGSNNGALPPGADLSKGRWPANVLFDEEAAAMLDEMSGQLKSGGGNKGNSPGVQGIFGRDSGKGFDAKYTSDSGGASRFFYCAKASKRERNAGLEGIVEAYAEVEGARLNQDASDNPNTKGRKSNPIDGLQNKKRQSQGNHHPTVKPLKLMEYLIKLICPPGGIVLDPFMGSGTTGCAASRLGYKFIGIELNVEYLEIAKKRIEHWGSQTLQPQEELDLEGA